MAAPPKLHLENFLPYRLSVLSNTVSGAIAAAYFAHFGWQGQGARVPDASTVWQASGQRLTPSTPVTLGAAGRFDAYWGYDNWAWDVLAGVVLFDLVTT